jgi:hypothetical protein
VGCGRAGHANQPGVAAVAVAAAASNHRHGPAICTNESLPPACSCSISTFRMHKRPSHIFFSAFRGVERQHIVHTKQLRPHATLDSIHLRPRVTRHSLPVLRLLRHPHKPPYYQYREPSQSCAKVKCRAITLQLASVWSTDVSLYSTRHPQADGHAIVGVSESFSLPG